MNHLIYSYKEGRVHTGGSSGGRAQYTTVMCRGIVTSQVEPTISSSESAEESLQKH